MKGLSSLQLAALLLFAFGVATPVHAALVNATDVNASPTVFEAWITADEKDVAIGAATAHAFVYKDDPPAPFLPASAGIPGPQIKAKVGDTVIVHFRNNLNTEAASIHWHGIELDNESDGTAVTQDAVLPGQSYTYRFRIFRPGVYWYHSHIQPGNATFAGMYGSLIIDNPIEPSLRGNKLPTLANTHTLVLSDIEFDATGKVGKGDPAKTINELVELCHLWAEGEPGGDMIACGTPGSPGKTVLVNGIEPAVGGLVPKFTVASGQRVRLQIINAAISRDFKLRVLNSGDNKIYRIGGEGGLLDHVILEGGVKQSWDSLYNLGELVIGSGDRADVIVVPSGGQGAMVKLVGGSMAVPFRTSLGLSDHYPLAYFEINGTASDTAIAVGDPILAGTAEDVENLKGNVAISPLQAPPPFGGSSDTTIRLTNQRPDRPNQAPSVDNFSAMLDTNVGNGDVANMPRTRVARYARLGDTLELSVKNETNAVHPFHLHGFSMQPVRYVSNTDGSTLRQWEYDEFLDEIEVYPEQTLVYRVRLDDRSRICDSSSGPNTGPVLAPCANAASGGAVGRWLFHCHIFHHAGLGMMGEIVLLPDLTPDPFVFLSLINVERSTPQLSNVITVSGINMAVPISVTGGEYALNGGSFGSAPGTAINGNTVQLRHVSSPAFSTSVTTTLNVGAASAGFTSTTLEEDLVPDAFHFIDRALVLPLFYYSSNTVTVSGINSNSPISIAGGSNATYSVNNGAFRRTPSTVKNGDTVRLRNVIPLIDLWGRPESVSATLNIGGVTDRWTISLLPPP
ncbi:MAG TPA: multicopper oxidase family protein [Solimonas sp.]|nr:multicopper oxidase family protein [Solimonas sp.]